MSALVATVRAAQRGDPKALERLVQRFFKASYSVALSIVRDPPDAEELAQESFMVAFRNLEQCREPERFAGWLMQIARNLARNRLLSHAARRQREQVSMLEESEARTVPQGDHGLQRQLLEAMEELTPMERETLLLHDLDEFAHGEIAEALQISVVSSRQFLFQARRKMRARLDAVGAKGGLDGRARV